PLAGAGLAQDQVAAARSRHRPLHDQQVLFSVDAHDLDVLHGHAVLTHVTAGAHALQHPRREGRGADRAGSAMEHRAVGRGAATEVVTLDDTLEALALADPDHHDAVP